MPQSWCANCGRMAQLEGQVKQISELTRDAITALQAEIAELQQEIELLKLAKKPRTRKAVQ